MLCAVVLYDYCFPSLAVGEDFTLSPTEVTFVIGANDGNTRSVFVDVLDDDDVEGTESFTLSGSTSSPEAVFVGGPATVSILDDDGKFGSDCSPPAKGCHEFMSDLACRDARE